VNRTPNQNVQTSQALTAAFDDQDRQFARAFSVLSDAIMGHAFPGVTLAVAHKGVLLASRGFGRFTYDSASPQVQANTIFDLASLTKVLATTAAAMVLYDRRLVRLDVPVAELLPEFTAVGPADESEQRRTISVRMLLAHSSGLPAYVKLFETARTRDEIFRAACGTPLVASPGSKAEYSDIGFILLGEILARLAGEPLNVFVNREVSAPLVMRHTCFNPPPEWRGGIPPTEDDRTFRHRIIQGEVNDENAWVMDGVSGHAGLFAPATDVSLFAECMLRGGSPIIRPDTVVLFTRRETTPADTSRALGWDTPSAPSTSGQYFSPSSFGHLGFTGTSLWIDPERQLSVTTLTNRIWPDRSSRAIRQVWPVLHDAVVEAL
jgi:CubicO group peptidase (beta-lactamase class C family)